MNFGAINSVISRPRSARPIRNDFNQGRLQRAWSCRPTRRAACSRDILKLNVANSQGKLVPLSALRRRRAGSMARCRRSATTAIPRCVSRAIRRRLQHGRRHQGDGRLASQLPAGFGYEWTGQTREEKARGFQAIITVRLRDPRGVPRARSAVRAGRSRCR